MTEYFLIEISIYQIIPLKFFSKLGIHMEIHIRPMRKEGGGGWDIISFKQVC